MSESSAPVFGLCPCGGVYSPREVEVKMNVADETVVFEHVPQGACPTCGGRVYKAATLKMLETVLRGQS
jgi:YgiT-type zinc finger domain-containing protein